MLSRSAILSRPVCWAASRVAVTIIFTPRAANFSSLPSFALSDSSSHGFFTSPPIRQGNPVVSNEQIKSTPESPWQARLKVCSAFPPRGVTIPQPVTTTLRLKEGRDIRVVLSKRVGLENVFLFLDFAQPIFNQVIPAGVHRGFATRAA